jgi:hypothetical protein
MPTYALSAHLHPSQRTTLLWMLFCMYWRCIAENTESALCLSLRMPLGCLDCL